MPTFEELWDFIGVPFGACVLIGVVLGYLGTHVIRREVIFVDIALAQFAAVGSTFAHFVPESFLTSAFNTTVSAITTSHY